MLEAGTEVCLHIESRRLSPPIVDFDLDGFRPYLFPDKPRPDHKGQVRSKGGSVTVPAWKAENRWRAAPFRVFCFAVRVEKG